MNKFGKFLTIPKLIFLAIAIALAAGGLFYYLRRDQLSYRDMAEYAPATAAAFIEVDSLSTLLSGVVGTQAWQKLAPVLSISDQLKYLGSVSDFLSFSGLGPDEAVILSRAQFAAIIDGLDAQSTPSPTEKDNSSAQQSSAQQLELVPHIAFIIETHAGEKRVSQLLTNRMNLLAQRIYGANIETIEQDYQGIKLTIFHAKDSDRQMVVAQRGSVVFIGNQPDSVKSCLDVALGRRPHLSDDPNLKQAREQFSAYKLAAFAYITGPAASRFLQIGNALAPGNISDKKAEQRAELAETLSSQLVNGAAYGATFENGEVSEHYSILLHPEIADALRAAVKPANGNSELVGYVPGVALDFTLLRVDQPAESLEQTLKGISAHANIVVSFALRNMVINLSRQFGIDANDPIGAFLGNELAMIKFPDADGDKFALLIEVRDKAKLLPTLARYLRSDSSAVRSEQYKDVEIVIGNDQRAAAFLGSYLALGTRAQIVKLIDNRQLDANSRHAIDLLRAASANHQQAIVISCRLDQQSAAELMLGISRLLRATDGSRAILNSPPVQSAIAQLPPGISFTEISNAGISVEAHSPLGALTMAAALLANPAGELRESQVETK